MRDGRFAGEVSAVPDNGRVEDVIALSKRHQATLGQLPYQSFHTSAQHGWILGAWEGAALAGYVMFRPRKRDGVIVITHLCVADEFQGRGVARRLIDALAVERPHAAGMILSCRADYPATQRWPRLGFDRIGRKPGRGKDGAELIRWWRQISALTLFTYLGAEFERLPAAALDTDVFRDIVEPREKHVDSIALDADWLSEFVELVTTPQVGTEVDSAAEMLPELRGAIDRYRRLQPTPDQWEPLDAELRRCVPGASVGAGDRRNLAQAGAGGATYFVTRDQAVLAKAPLIEQALGIKVLRPAGLGLAIHSDQFEAAYRPEALRASNYEIRHPTTVPTAADVAPFTDRDVDHKARALADVLHATAAAAQEGGRLWELVDPDGQRLALAATTTDATHLTVDLLRVRLCANRDMIARQLLHRFREEAVAAGLAAVDLLEPVAPHLEAHLLNEGYAKGTQRWTAECRTGIVGAADVVTGIDLEVAVSALAPEDVSALERRFWPLKVISGAVPTFIVPIQPGFARALFDDAPEQLELMSRPDRLGVARQHVYYCALKQTIVAPARVLWWVSGSGPNSGMRAWSWLDHVAHERPRTLFKWFGTQGIYDIRDVEAKANSPGKRVTALLFSRTETFPTPIKIKQAKALYADIGRNGYLQTTQRADEHVFESFYRYGRNPA